MILSKVARTIDCFFIRRAGVYYTLLTRDWMIHERIKYLIGWIQRQPGNVRVLDVGCGAGLALVHLQAYCAAKVSAYVGIDLHAERVIERYAFISIAHEFLTIDIDSSWQLGTFDVIFCSEVMEHILEDQRLFSRLCNHLRPDGILLVTTPRKSFVLRWAALFPGLDSVSATQDGGHVRIGYDPEELETLGQREGLIAIERQGLGKMSLNELARRRALMRNGEYVNTPRFNIRWLFEGGGEYASVDTDQYWSVAVAFRRNRDLSVSTRVPAAANGGRR